MSNHEIFHVRLRAVNSQPRDDPQPMLCTVQELFQSRSFARVLTQQNMPHRCTAYVRVCPDKIQISSFLRAFLNDLNGATVSPNSIQQFWCCPFDAFQFVRTPEDVTVGGTCWRSFAIRSNRVSGQATRIANKPRFMLSIQPSLMCRAHRTGARRHW